MPTGPIYTTPPSVSRSSESAYKKAPSVSNAPSQSVNKAYSGSAVSGGNAHCMSDSEYYPGLNALFEKHVADIDKNPYTADFNKYKQEEKNYKWAAFSSCLDYYNTASNPDCTKLDRLWILMASTGEYDKALSEVKSSAHLKAVCGNSSDYNSLF